MPDDPNPARADRSGAPRIVIIGGGFAGATAAQALERRLRKADIHLVSAENHLTYNPLLPEVVGASVLPGHVVAPLRQMVHRARVHQVRVTAVDTTARRVHYDGGCESGSLGYDHLVLACGSSANLRMIPGMAEHALPLKTVGDALFLRNRVISRLEDAELTDNPTLRRWLKTFVVVGGGFSGVEVAGEISDFLTESGRWYSHSQLEPPRVVIVHGGPHLLPELPERLGRFTERKLARHGGVEVRLNSRSDAIDGRGVTLDNGSRIEAGTVVSTIGTAPSPLIEALPAEKQRGRLRVDADMSVPGLPGVWAIGDCAAVPNSYGDGAPCPPTAQFALRQGPQLAANIARRERGEPTRPFGYRPKGLMSAIGHNRAVARVWGINLSGFIPWLLWRGFYLLYIPTFARKARVYLEWNWAMFFPPDIAHLRFTRTVDERDDT
ncbi:MAG: FAD-dependent oxidoreductase [Gammaproteobacteria bacterium]|jgi:NADH dehydrogenase|nr:FAD-dependent oxidoreductase [Gammaproteobacteria bacterium]